MGPAMSGERPWGRDAGLVDAVDGTDRWRLLDEEDFLVRSLEDAAAEHGAGDLSDEDYRLLVERDRRRLAAVRQALTATAGAGAGGAGDAPANGAAHAGKAASAPRRRAGPAAGSKGTGRRRRWWLAAIGVAAVVAGIVLLVFDVTSPRLPGQTPTGGMTLSTDQKVTQQLSQAATLVNDRNLEGALKVYRAILAEDPRQPEALTEWGWLTWQVGERAHNRAVMEASVRSLQTAVRIDPGFFGARLYLGTVDEEAGKDSAALVQYAAFLADRPSAAWVREAAPFLEQAYRAEGRPIPQKVIADDGGHDK